jgi:hydrogenase expression/formation protein HypE
MKHIEIGHGSGGKLTRDLIEQLFLKHLSSKELNPLEDAATLTLSKAHIAVSTDSYVVSPLFFPGGNIGKLAVCGTINDLVVSGARPGYLAIGFILEEGFSINSLEKILGSIHEAVKESGVHIVTGDTKVVEKGRCDGIYINTTGIGEIVRDLPLHEVATGDAIIMTGTVGDHGTAVALARNEFHIDAPVTSDCASLHELLMPLVEMEGVRWMRDPTRGGVATVLAELSDTAGIGIQVFEDKVPVREDVRFISDMLGYDPLYLANEGKAVIVTSAEKANEAVTLLKKHPLGKYAAVIGHVTAKYRGARLRTKIGGERLLEMLEEELLPRIC